MSQLVTLKQIAVNQWQDHRKTIILLIKIYVKQISNQKMSQLILVNFRALKLAMEMNALLTLLKGFMRLQMIKGLALLRALMVAALNAPQAAL